MSGTISIDLPKSAIARVTAEDLRKIVAGLSALGLHAHSLEAAADLIIKQALENEHMKSDQAYTAGHKDGWDAAIATGLVGDGDLEALTKTMTERFLAWKLPEDFSPDGGIAFEPVGNKGTAYAYRREPVGTNLLNYSQAKELVRFMIGGRIDQGGNDA